MNEIDHDGIVDEVRGNVLKVRIVTVAACVSCQMKKVCNPSDMKEKVFDVPVDDPQNYSAGDLVRLSISEGMGILAAVLGYVVPVVLLMAGVLGGVSAGLNELEASGIGLGAALVYYLILFLTRKKASKAFSFKVTRV
jgi:sigma-E factor negative regulatory protein RseC